ncbi:hypothetical protein KSP39_PZI009914 [Platanthera zijinensis]|uniref:Uncharacterized protein n=1 Tax=Platanthera zijinensis TaxID=2320716 RepID=A0AAP0G739_9ASPA
MANRPSSSLSPPRSGRNPSPPSLSPHRLACASRPSECRRHSNPVPSSGRGGAGLAWTDVGRGPGRVLPHQRHLPREGGGGGVIGKRVSCSTQKLFCFFGSLFSFSDGDRRCKAAGPLLEGSPAPGAPT